MAHFSLLFVIMFLPLLGAIFLLFIRGDAAIVESNARRVSVLITATTFLASLCAWGVFGNYDFSFEKQWLPSFHLIWRTDLDALSLAFVLLICSLSFIAALTVKNSVRTMVREYLFLTLVLESLMLIAVCARGVFLLFASYEACVFPLFMLISFWGIERRVFSAFKFCFYTMFGGVFLLCVVYFLFMGTQGTGFETLGHLNLPPATKTFVFIALLAAFAFKAPLFPFHAWFPEAFSEAPLPTAVMLSGAFSKLILYVFLRLALPCFGEEMRIYAPLLTGWAVFSAVYGALVALMQKDLKKMAGYACLTQSGLLAAGMFCLTSGALRAVVFSVMAQGLCVTAYLIALTALTDRFTAAGVRLPQGAIKLYPKLCVFFFFATLCFLAVPPAVPFSGQFQIFDALFSLNARTAGFMMLANVVLAAAFFKNFSVSLFGEIPDRVLEQPDMTQTESFYFWLFGAVVVFCSAAPSGLYDLAGQAVMSLTVG